MVEYTHTKEREIRKCVGDSSLSRTPKRVVERKKDEPAAKREEEEEEEEDKEGFVEKRKR